MSRVFNFNAGPAVLPVEVLEEATALLWKMHHPWLVWVILGAVGLLATLAMVGYYFKTKDRGISSAAA